MSTTKEATRVRLFEAAKDLLLSRGFHDVTLEDIAAAAGVSRQAVYKSHFASKAELVLELVRYQHVADKLDELTRPYFAAQSGLEMLSEGIRAIVLIEVRIHDLAMALAAAAASDPAAAAALDDRLKVKHGALRKALERVQTDGDFNPTWQVDEALDVLAALLSVDSYERLVAQRGWKPEQLIARIREISQIFLLKPGRAAKQRAKLPQRSRESIEK